MLKKFCRCGKIISQEKKMCEKCEERLNKQNKKRYQDYKANRTDTKEQKFYLSREWILTKPIVKQRDKGLCILCLFNGKISYVDLIHHIETLKDMWSKRLSIDNLVCLCDRCHKRVHREYDKDSTSKKAMQEQLHKLIRNCRHREGEVKKF